MNVVKIKTIRSSAAAFLLALMMILNPSCKKDNDFGMDTLEEDREQIEQQNKIMEYLVAAEHEAEAIEFRENMVIVNDLSAYVMSDLLDVINGNVEWNLPEDPDAEDMLSTADDRQRGVTESNRLNAVTKQNVESIRYFIRASVANDCSNSWVNAMNSAAATWNAVSNCRATFIRTFTQSAADIIVASENDNVLPTAMQNLPNANLGLANASLNGAAGSFIAIADNHDLLPNKQRTALSMFGIALGFTFTGTNIGQHIHGTPVTQNNSIMNPNWSTGSTTFQSGDLRMARIYYPNSLDRPIHFQAFETSQGRLQVNYYNPNHIVKPYYWVRVAKYTASGAIIAVRYFRSTTTHPVYGFDTVIWSGHGSGTYRFAVRGCNFRRDVWSHRTPQINVTF